MSDLFFSRTQMNLKHLGHYKEQEQKKDGDSKGGQTERYEGTDRITEERIEIRRWALDDIQRNIKSRKREIA